MVWVEVGGINVEVTDGWTTGVCVASSIGMVSVDVNAGGAGLLATGVFDAEIKISWVGEVVGMTGTVAVGSTAKLLSWAKLGGITGEFLRELDS